MDKEEIRAWAERIGESGETWVYYKPAALIGQVRGVSLTPVHNGVVFDMCTGDVLHATPDNFIVLTPRDVEFFTKSKSYLVDFLMESRKLSRALELPADQSTTLLLATLKAQVRSMEAHGERMKALGAK